MFPNRHNLLDDSHGRVTLMPWLLASATERSKAFRSAQTLGIVERWSRNRRGGRRALVELFALLAIDRGRARGLSDDRLAEEILDAVKARQLIAVPGWGESRAEPVAPPVREELPAPPPARVKKEATGSELEPTIRLVNLESRYFVPHVESIRISYAIDGPLAKAAEVRMKVKALGGGFDAGRLVEERTLPAPSEATGSVVWNGRAAMGAGYITLRGSPYEVSFELTSTSGGVSVSESANVEVAVSSVHIRVEASERLPVAEEQRSAIATLAADLEKGGLPGDSSGRVMIDSPIFPVNHEEMSGPTSATEYARWAGDGIAIPLFLEIRLKSKTGAEMRSPAALVGSRVLWDFTYQNAEELAGALKERNLVEAQEDFLIKVLTAREDDSLPKGTALRRALGGRRASPRSSGWGKSTFWKSCAPWPMARPSARTWAVFTDCVGEPTLWADGAVYFMSGRIAGDVHKIQATLDRDEVLDSRDDDLGVESALRSNVMTCTNWRRVPIIANWFVGETEEFDLATVRAAFAPAAMLVEAAPGLVRSDLTEHWTRHYARIAQRAREEAWEFVADALDPDPEGQAVRFRPLEDFHKALEARSYLESVRRRARNFLIARNESEYRLKCEKHVWKIFDDLLATLDVPAGGLTMVKFGADRLHNKQDASNEVGGLAVYQGRHKGLVLQFTRGVYPKITIHEVGHALFLMHAPGHKPGVRDPRDVDLTAHDPNVACAMSYTRSRIFCGMCLLRLGGADHTKVHDGSRNRD